MEKRDEIGSMFEECKYIEYTGKIYGRVLINRGIESTKEQVEGDHGKTGEGEYADRGIF